MTGRTKLAIAEKSLLFNEGNKNSNWLLKKNKNSNYKKALQIFAVAPLQNSNQVRKRPSMDRIKKSKEKNINITL